MLYFLFFHGGVIFSDAQVCVTVQHQLFRCLKSTFLVVRNPFRQISSCAPVPNPDPPSSSLICDHFILTQFDMQPLLQHCAASFRSITQPPFFRSIRDLCRVLSPSSSAFNQASTQLHIAANRTDCIMMLE